MPIFQLILIALIQGITEFLPVSSSAHLILFPKLTGLQDQGLAIDVAVHIGTLLAVLLYLKADIKLLFQGLIQAFGFKRRNNAFSLLCYLIMATIPVVLFGFLIKLVNLDESLRSIKIIAWAMLIFGLILYYTDQKNIDTKKTGDWSYRSALIMGFWQALALIPGTSRAGAVISGARLLGFSRQDSAKLAMLMAIPTIIASGALLSVEIIASGSLSLARDFFLAIAFSFSAALLSIRLMMYFLTKYSFTPYVVYRLLLSLILLAIIY
ncbi:MAG: undecaprenyl-diphosphate phosphatase [Paracoccaceae bacterium]